MLSHYRDGRRLKELGCLCGGIILNTMSYDQIKCPIAECEEFLEILGDDLVCPTHGAVYLDDYVQDEPVE